MEINFNELNKELSADMGDCNLTKYFSWLDNQISNKPKLFEEKYLPIINEENNNKEKRPTFSVIVRTQGKRIEPLREMLLSLEAQTDKDFEILLIGHKLDKEHKSTVEWILNDLPSGLMEKIRYFDLNCGTRATPLNFGFAHARGEYAVILDDDDIVMDDWISQFHDGMKNSMGKLLHSYVLTQKWEMVTSLDGVLSCRASDAPQTIHCKDFDVFDQIKTNYCPLMGIAFPLSIFRKFGIIFDEKLDTTEDWDYIMRVAFLTGVTDLRRPTAIYRLWENAENSQTLHSKEIWQKNHIIIQERLSKMPIILTENEKKSFSLESALKAWKNKQLYSRLPNIGVSTLYYNIGNGFNENDTLHSITMFDKENFDVSFNYPQNKENPKNIRFDLTEEGLFSANDIVCVLRYENGEREFLLQDDAQTNGVATENDIFFPFTDPWISWEISPSNKKIISIQIIGKVFCKMDQKTIKAICDKGIENSSDEKAKLYYCINGGFDEEKTIKSKVDYQEDCFDIRFDYPKSEKSPSNIRFDLTERGNLSLSNVSGIIILDDSRVVLLTQSDAQTNGKIQKDGIYFNDGDPWISWKVPSSVKKIKAIRIMGKVSFYD